MLVGLKEVLAEGAKRKIGIANFNVVERNFVAISCKRHIINAINICIIFTMLHNA